VKYKADQIITDDVDAALQSDEGRTLLTLWREKAGERRFPRRDDLDVLELQPWVGRLALVDHNPKDGYRYSLYGTDIARRTGHDLTGVSLRERDVEIGELVRRQYDAVRDLAAPALVFFPVFEDLVGHELQTGALVEKLLLPLSRGGAVVDCVMIHSIEFTLDGGDAA